MPSSVPIGFTNTKSKEHYVVTNAEIRHDSYLIGYEVFAATAGSLFVYVGLNKMIFQNKNLVRFLYFGL